MGGGGEIRGLSLLEFKDDILYANRMGVIDCSRPQTYFL